MQPKKLFRDDICLWLNTVSLEQAIATARDMRSCTRTIWLSPNFYAAHGPSGMRCFHELGIVDVILDIKLLGSPSETWQCVMEIAKHGARAISIHVLAGKLAIQHAIKAAEASLQYTRYVKRPLILVSMLPVSVNDAEMVDQLCMRVKRAGHVEQAASQALEAGADGIVAEYEDIKHVRKTAKTLPIVVFSQKPMRNYEELEHNGDKAKAGITELLRARVNHVVFDSTMVQKMDIEWAADLISKEVQQFLRSK